MAYFSHRGASNRLRCGRNLPADRPVVEEQRLASSSCFGAEYVSSARSTPDTDAESFGTAKFSAANCALLLINKTTAPNFCWPLAKRSNCDNRNRQLCAC